MRVSVWWAHTQQDDDDGDPAGDLLRAAVADRDGCEPAAVGLGRLCPACAAVGHGRPVVLAPARSRWRVSLARAPGLVTVAVADGCDVGVDVEEVARTAFAGFPAVALHPQEQDGSPGERGLIWTRKEAVLKAVGVGLRTDPRSVRVSPVSEPPEILEGLNVAPGQRLWLEDIPVPVAYAATVAVVAPAATAPEVTVRAVVRGASAGGASAGRGRRDPHRSGRPPRR